METMEEVRGVILDESVVLGCDDENGDASVRPGAQYVLRKLRYSTIPTGILFGRTLPADKVSVIKSLATLHKCSWFILEPTCVESTLSEIERSWVDARGRILYVASESKKDIFLQLSNQGWLITVPRSIVQDSAVRESEDFGNERAGLLYIDKLEELPLIICRLNKKAFSSNILTVAFVMKPSREEDFAKRGAFPMRPTTPDGLIFAPLSFELPVSSQLEGVDVILHKATDEIISVEMSSSEEFHSRINFTKGMLELKRHIEQYRNCCTIDPLKNIYPILDRLKIQEVLHGLEGFQREGQNSIRGSHFLKVDNFNDPNLRQKLSECQLSLPTIVKPQVACGVADAHSMAIVFRLEDYKDLNVPLPAIIQEYVDHSSSIFKFYVLGEEVFYAVKTSTPNASVLMKLSEKDGCRPLVFDSLKSLPVQTANQHIEGAPSTKVNNQCMDLGLVTDAANWLRERLDLTIFGFDVVVQEGTGDHVIVDVNYLPSFKEVPDDIAIPSFWKAIKGRFKSMATRPTASSLPVIT